MTEDFVRNIINKKNIDMEKNLKFAAVVLFALSCALLVRVQISELSNPQAMDVASFMVAFGFIGANACLSLLFIKNNGSEKFSLEDFAALAAITLAQGVFLGMGLMLVALVVPFKSEILPALFWATVGPVSLGMLALAIFFAINAYIRLKFKDWWVMLQAVAVAIMMSSVGLAMASLFSLVAFSNEAMDILGLLILVGFVMAMAAVFIPIWLEKMNMKTKRG